MLKMVDIEYIRKKHFVEGWGIRKIARQFRISRQSVRKALASAEIPRYKLTVDKPSPVMDPYREVITNWLKADEKAPVKQRHTARRIYTRLVAEYGFTGAESTVRRYVARLRQKQAEVFIPLTSDAGEVAEVDWGDARAIIGGKREVIWLFCLRLRFSGVCFVRAYRTGRLEAFLDGHRRAFEWLGGVPALGRYDNLRSAVIKVLAGPEREEHQLFSSLRAHYLFESIFCQVGKGNEKGSVENLVGYVRRNALVPLPEVDSWEELNEKLLRWSEAERVRNARAWEEERRALRPLPPQPHGCSRTYLLVVDRQSLVHFERNRYSVPARYVRERVRLEAYVDRVEIWHRQTLIATHPRSYQRGETFVALEHYLPAIARKKRSVLHALAVRRLPAIYAEVKKELLASSPTGYREFAAILMLHQEFTADEVQKALREANERGCCDAANVRQILLAATQAPQPAAIGVPEQLKEVRVQAPDLARYDQLWQQEVTL